MVGIVAGGTIGLSNRARLSPASESYVKAGLAAFTVFYGLRLTWLGLNGSPLNILKQFLIEAIVLTGAGGFIGVLIGFGIAMLVRVATPLPAAVSLWSVALGLSVSIGIGLCFGIFPAQKAARMDPIVSLRYE